MLYSMLLSKSNPRKDSWALRGTRVNLSRYLGLKQQRAVDITVDHQYNPKSRDSGLKIPLVLHTIAGI
jgi:hypothetical protein